jgi:hypothetical protein
MESEAHRSRHRGQFVGEALVSPQHLPRSGEVPGSNFLAPCFTHLTRDLLGDSDVVYLDVTTLTRKFPAVREEARKIGDSLTGLVKEEPAVDAHTRPATAPTDSPPAATMP